MWILIESWRRTCLYRAGRECRLVGRTVEWSKWDWMKSQWDRKRRTVRYHCHFDHHFSLLTVLMEPSWKKKTTTLGLFGICGPTSCVDALEVNQRTHSPGSWSESPGKVPVIDSAARLESEVKTCQWKKPQSPMTKIQISGNADEGLSCVPTWPGATCEASRGSSRRTCQTY